ncbi:3-hydroxyacyl-ACP dehydratase FabZ [Buchnera aphidicola str. APS (Acyrthosiphon pisum)]|uniref:3-hydroxyacyl-[acyl-carrier-protein] dehydratase FabZ n=2 Tax=Buchnera aphidicola TaxID=9 RepID=FABZ_BUCA5|nr:3-hydroxyacyl-ACP dehydratase FabZ [Buchnera aphidicola]B8D7D9.1 RecName: Full=3-hydroxyacyl-[acyl-carrier-protein] dehydratase FabZ; AltName: Full=(3R)-hydroxymyristoyl-[acyl-carrier-protein] dehydratase; Short=(3R)-hydroxymyristoyl-ACP dehydrase; AltName: Full=Beta-hydroxyacyl-ACP dehydratase [Buchnera aphidicola str. Tuc7 (Acyrthosiphon pisum)]B8D935.1 RecName: Full=3-hydroxyacyl-[acyl-carrier-protein] dehydratase FabZ; AltName: Full=(3R)-hydroxymyristoyl-[acyl-carrier-protein] dehydratase;
MNVINNTLNIKKIFKILPHRYPFLLIDRVLNFEKFKYLQAIKNCSINEPYFQGHFSNEPVFPGVLIIESMAQAASILIYKSTGELNINKLYYFVGVDDTRFKKIAIPGDQIFIKVTILKSNKNILIFKNIAVVNNDIICKSKIVFAKKYLF